MPQCPKCYKEIIDPTTTICRVPSCPTTEPVNTSGKIRELFTVDGGFAIECHDDHTKSVQFLSGGYSL